MTIREALELGLLRTEPVLDTNGISKGNRVVTIDGTYTLWHDARRSKPYRFAPVEKPSKRDLADGTAGGNYGGADSLDDALRHAVLLRSQGCR